MYTRHGIRPLVMLSTKKKKEEETHDDLDSEWVSKQIMSKQIMRRNNGPKNPLQRHQINEKAGGIGGMRLVEIRNTNKTHRWWKDLMGFCKNAKGVGLPNTEKAGRKSHVTQKLIEKILHLDILWWNLIPPKIDKSPKSSKTRMITHIKKKQESCCIGRNDGATRSLFWVSRETAYDSRVLILFNLLLSKQCSNVK